MKKLFFNLLLGLNVFLLCSCSKTNLSEQIYNQGLNVLPLPNQLEMAQGNFALSNQTVIYVSDPSVKSVATFYAEKMKASTGFNFPVVDQTQVGAIELHLTAKNVYPAEGYELNVSDEKVEVKASTAQGLFYGMASFMQLLPAEIESREVIADAVWKAPAIRISDAPRLPYRGLMIDVARHFVSVEGLKKHIDMLATFKINRLHLHLTDFQGWRIEIKKYPRLTQVGSKRIDEYGKEYSGFYTQEEMREIVKYAADRFITIIPEVDVPGHSLGAVASYPNLSCTGDQYEVLSRWGFFPVVMCPGKEDMFEFLDGVFAELSQIFPSEYFHIGGDECPKEVWKTCKACQQRIRHEHLKGDRRHTAEQRLQSYAIQRCEKILHKYGKKMIGWDEILQGGVADDATVMSWRGEKGGIEAALMNHQVIMTPNSGGMYFDFYQGDPMVEPFAWGAYAPIVKAYNYNPVPDTLKAINKEKYIYGVQGNVWSECLYTEDKVEYQVYPRILAVAETGWTQQEKKNFDDFSRRLNNAAVRMDQHQINYHIPLPEQPGGSCSYLGLVDTLSVAFQTTRPVKMVYTLDGSEPTLQSAEYKAPLHFNASATLKIRSVLPSNKMSLVRTIHIEQQDYAEPMYKEMPKQVNEGMRLKVADVKCMKLAELAQVKEWKDSVITEVRDIAHLRPNFFRNVVYHVAIGEGLIEIPADGVYFFKSDNSRVWIGDRLAVDNDDKPQVNSKYGRSIALRKGIHKMKIEQISNFIGGWNAQHRNSGNVFIKQGKWQPVKAYYE